MPQGIGYDPATLAALGMAPQMAMGAPVPPMAPGLVGMFDEQMMMGQAPKTSLGYAQAQAPSAMSTARATQSGPSATSNRMDPSQYSWGKFTDQQLLQASGMGNLGMRNAAAAEAQRRGTMLKDIQMQQAQQRMQ